MNFLNFQITSTLVRKDVYRNEKVFFEVKKQYCRHNIWDLKISLQRTWKANQEGAEACTCGNYAGVCSGLIVADKPETAK